MLTRRSLLAGAALLPAATWAVPTASAVPVAGRVGQPEIRPRTDWATAKQAVRGALAVEEDVRFLLVHHTLTPNEDGPERIGQRLRSIHSFHTGEQRGWPDVAYNFFVDAYGVIWEGRQGSIAGPVRGDATGGSQGYALLCCFVGDFTAREPTPEAMASMTHLLAWLAVREDLDLGGRVEFVSRGSSKWRQGVAVSTEQVAAHRDMSVTRCPGDALYPLVASRLLPDAQAMLAGPSAEPATPDPPPPSAASGPDSAVTPASPPEASGSAADAAPWMAAGAVALTGAVAGVILGRRGARARAGSGAEQAHGDRETADQQDPEESDEEPRGRP